MRTTDPHGVEKLHHSAGRHHNAWAYKWSLRQVVADLGARQIFIKPHCPWQNGKVERLNRTLLVEWAYRQAYLSNEDRTAALAPWHEHYNTQRRHSALGGRPPMSTASSWSPLVAIGSPHSSSGFQLVLMGVPPRLRACFIR